MPRDMQQDQKETPRTPAIQTDMSKDQCLNPKAPVVSLSFEDSHKGKRRFGTNPQSYLGKSNLPIEDHPSINYKICLIYIISKPQPSRW